MTRQEGFSGFLHNYCNALCGLTEKKTRSVKKLFALASQSYPTAVEPLFLYAVDVGRIDELMSYARRAKSQRFECYEDAYGLVNAGDRGAQEFVEKNKNRLGDGFLKVYTAWKARCDRPSNELRMKELMLIQIRARLDRRGAAHQVCRELGLNAGNFYAYLKGDASKVSLATARRILNATKSLSV